MDGVSAGEKKTMKIYQQLRDIGMITFLVLFFYVLFLILGMFQQIDYSSFGVSPAEKSISGNAIRVGNSITINATVDPKPPAQQQKKNEWSNNMQCWKKAGLTVQDFAIVGNMLEEMPCQAAATKKRVATQRNENCLQVAVENEIQASICYAGAEDEMPSLRVIIPSAEEPLSSISLPETRRNYLPAIIFLLIVFGVFGFWSWDELRASFIKQDHFKPYDELELRYGSHRVPKYEQRTEAMQMDEGTEKIFQQLRREHDQKNVQELLTKKQVREKMLVLNTSCDIFAAAARRNDIVGAQLASEKIFAVFFPLYRSLPSEDQKILLERVFGLEKQLNLLKKSTAISSLIKKSYAELQKPMFVPSPATRSQQFANNQLEKNIQALQQSLKKKQQKTAQNNVTTRE